MLAGAGCLPNPGGNDPSDESAARLWLDDRDDGTTQQIAAGGRISLELVGSPGSTGYTWELTSDNLPYVRPRNRYYSMGSGDELGSPGHYNFIFDAVQPGTTTITVGLMAPGEETPADTFEVTIEVVGETPEVGGSIAVEERDNGETFTLLIGERLRIELVGGPEGSSSVWEVQADGSPVLERTDSLFVPSSSDLLSDYGFYVFDFNAVASGQTTVTVVLNADAEGGPAATYTLTVEVP